jgi:hypothetical protein
MSPTRLDPFVRIGFVIALLVAAIELARCAVTFWCGFSPTPQANLTEGSHSPLRKSALKERRRELWMSVRGLMILNGQW